jgi:Fic family protein
MRKTGDYYKLGELNYFIPHPLPPLNPPLELNAEIMSLYGEASFALGQLNEMSLRLPDPKRFIKAYVIKEALLSSAIEGIHTTILEVFTQSLEESKKVNKDTQLVLNYHEALDTALSMIKDEGLPLVTRVILRAHEALLYGGEGDKAAPEISKLMSDLEKYINEPSDIPVLIRAGLAHVQFETIHPFADGNGRIGRLLIILMLVDSKLLSLPVLYPSYYFKKHHFEYYQTLDRVRTNGDFEGWIFYYLKAIKNSAIDAHTRAKEIESLEVQLKYMILNNHEFTKMRDTALSVLDFLFTQPVTGIAEMSKKLGKAYNTANNILNIFVKLGFVSESIIHKRNKLYRFTAYLNLLEKEY